MRSKRLAIVILSIALVACMLFAAACGVIENQVDNNGETNNPSENGNSSVNGSSQKLNILKSDLKLTQEQVASQIKAEYLLKNNGYQDDDDVVVIVGLDGDSLVESFNKKYYGKYATVADFAVSEDGIAIKNKLHSKQDETIARLQNRGFVQNVKYRYTTVTNAVAVTVKYGDLRRIEGASGVSSVMLSDTYNRPQTAKVTDGSTVTNLVDVYEDTGIFNSGSVSYTGKRTAVAILDSGFDISHEVFSKMPARSDMLIDFSKVSGIIDNTNASELTRNLQAYNVYQNEKVPFAYDYADKDYDVYPYDSEHGTHVAGIIGGSSDTITGVAVDTQLVLMKVFPDLDDGGRTEDILAALEDAVLLEVDAINMSLGSSCGFTREYDNDKLNQIYQSINDAGISLLTAASNSYSSGYGGAQGNTNFVTNPDSSTVGSPSTYPASLSVASISGVKSKYLLANGKDVIFFNESNDITGKANDFFAELYQALGKEQGETITLDYVIVPGSGLQISYSSIDVKGKIAVVRRGDNSFEDKALIAKSRGAVACIIYNNLDGDILMSMGKTAHIPTISISKDDGMALVSSGNGTMTIKYSNAAGPFMSDFSSWGPTPSLELKPEITAHGGDIYSSVPNGGYDHLSGTSMATPNLCGVMVLIRQYLKEKYPGMAMKELSNLANQMLMSTATIVFNEEGNPYSPRKQGAGLASLKNVVNTDAYLSVDGKDRPKLELKDDPNRAGVYEMEFNVVNISANSLQYDMSLVAMTETVSKYDEKHVAETPHILGNNVVFTVSGDGTQNGNTVTVKPNGSAKIKAVYTLSYEDREYIDSLFPYGMYVEGFVKLAQKGHGDNNIDLNIPFLAFYGDWTQAPMFDKTYYEVENEKYDTSIEDEDKLQADYYATTPYGSYFYNYIIPLGTYLYDVDTLSYDEIPASREHIAISNILGTIDGISAVYAGLLRCARTMEFTITDKLTGEVMWSHTDYNATKAYSLGGEPIPYFDYLRLHSRDLHLINNRQYEFKMHGTLDYGDGGKANNVRNEFSFDFYLDDEAPVLKEVSYEKEYDENLKKDRYYINMVIYDNQYVQSVSPIRFTSNSSYSFLTDNPIPVYSQKGTDNRVRFEITSYLDDLFADTMITSGLAFSIDDYALNSNIYICELPGTRGTFKFTKDGDMEGTDLIILSAYEGEIIDVTKYLATADETVDINKDYLKYLNWTSSNENVAQVANGQVKCVKEGRATVTVKEQMELNQAVLIINVKPRPQNYQPSDNVVDDVSGSSINELRFSYFETVFAYSRAAQTSEIGSTGGRMFISSMNSVSFYPGEKIKLIPDLKPWYTADKYELTYTSTNPSVAIVDQDGVVTGLKKGSTTIALQVSGSRLIARLSVEIKSEFVIDNRTLVAYKGLGGDVVIPDDEGILYIGAYAFCLYDTDNTFELTEDDYDANKIPNANTSVTSVTIPHGVEEIQKYAFYNCSGLRAVHLPDTLKIIREYAFYGDKKLEDVNLTGTKVETIGRSAFTDCKKLAAIDLSHVYAIGTAAFDGCEALTKVDLSSLRNTGAQAFQDCKSLSEVKLVKATKLSYAMFARSGLKSVDIYSEDCDIPTFCFARCDELATVNIHNNIERIGTGAFSDCPKLTKVNITGAVNVIGDQAFYNDKGLTAFTLPNNAVTIQNHAFYKCANLSELVIRPNTEILQAEAVVSKDELSSDKNFVAPNVNGNLFADTKLTKFTVESGNTKYSVNADGSLLLGDGGATVLLAAVGKQFGAYTLDVSYEKIAQGAFAGADITSLVITNANTVIGDYAFANCTKLTFITLPAATGVILGNYAFNGDEQLTAANNLEFVKSIGRYAFASTALDSVSIGENAVCGEGAFLNAKLKQVTIGANASFGLGAFQNCSSLATVNMPEQGGVYFGKGCFAKDVSLVTIDLSKVGDTIADECFYGCRRLVVAHLTNVKHIGNYAFADCSALAIVTVPAAEYMGDGAFGRYDQYGSAPIFEQIALPDTLTHLGEGAFIGCSGLRSVTVPSAITAIPDYTFAFNVRLTEVNLPDTITEVGEYAFAGCESLSRVVNINKVQVIKQYAFNSCASLATATLSEVKEIGFGAFASSALTGHVAAPNLEKIGDYAFQNARIINFTADVLKSIGECAFQGCTQLREFVLSPYVEYVGPMAFNGCDRLTSFYGREDGVTFTDGKINDYAKLSEGALYTMMDSGHYMLSSVPGGMDTAVFEVAEGTTRIEAYAGNSNKYITYLILPDSLKTIGHYAFYGCKALETVEFKSVVAPALENSYDRRLTLAETDPGFGLLHNQFDVFNYELCYCTFIDLAGKKEPIAMVLPVNGKLIGYESVVYEAYFGKVEDARRSEYTAMEKNLVDFFDYAEAVSKLDVIRMDDEELINDALSCYNAVTQNPSDFGYDINYYYRLVDTVKEAKQTVTKLKLTNATKQVRDVQALIDALPATFTVNALASLQQVRAAMSALEADGRAILDLTKYNALTAAYNKYCQDLQTEIAPVTGRINVAAVVQTVAAASMLAAAAFVIKRSV